ncbi:hypothetical protein CAPTEDRAFT_207668 [Capitella teleta]|uniref:Uncharacterized protein n=1 Tax=Capitella teleta TaxID=283909 RepID=R7V0Y4_CAPTE|nr:hypothetical protein CAPTEDRAFT_207668 [Capitella teleta]|eukprot:ELU09882.1 hypothetical protein CAPTEDRAFT_207668 [Capitella teleta]
MRNVTAKQALWSSSACVPAIGPWKPRKGSSNKLRQEFEIDDIFDALSKLDEASVKPVIHVPTLDLDLLLPMNPAQLLPVIFLDKMNEMEAKMTTMQAQIDNLGKREQVCGHGRNEMAHRSTSRSDFRRSTGQQTETRPAVPNPAGPAPPSMSVGSHAKSPPQDPERWPHRQDTASTSVKRVDTGEEETKQEHSNEWTEVVKRKSKKNPLKERVRKAAKEAEVIVGTKVDEDLSASNPIKHLFVNRLNNYHGVDDMKSFLLKNQVQARGIKKDIKR